jgi:hypothetical protein
MTTVQFSLQDHQVVSGTVTFTVTLWRLVPASEIAALNAESQPLDVMSSNFLCFDDAYPYEEEGYAQWGITETDHGSNAMPMPGGTVGPYTAISTITYSWDTTQVPNGEHLLSYYVENSYLSLYSGWGEVSVMVINSPYTVSTPTVTLNTPPSTYTHFSRGAGFNTTPVTTGASSGLSCFPISLFNIDQDILESAPAIPGYPSLTVMLQAAGFNALEFGFTTEYGFGDTLAQAKTAIDDAINPQIAFCQANNFLIVGLGDDIFHLPEDVSGYSNSTSYSGESAIQYAIAKLVASGICACLCLCDEVNNGWGPTPFPTTEQAAGIAAYNVSGYPVANTAFTTLIGYLNASPNCPPFTFEVLGSTDPTIAAAWMSTPATSWAFMYFTQQTNPPYSGDAVSTLPADQGNIAGATTTRLAAFPSNWPFGCLVDVSGQGFTEQSNGNGAAENFNVFIDYADDAATQPQNVVANAWSAIVRGAISLRYYAYDGGSGAPPGYPGAYYERTIATNGEFVTINCDPYRTPAMWAAITLANSLINEVMIHLCQPLQVVPNLGPDILVGARDGTLSRLVILINVVGTRRQVNLDLTPYWTGTCTMYQALYPNSGVMSGPNTEEKLSLVLESGEVRLFLMPKA